MCDELMGVGDGLGTIGGVHRRHVTPAIRCTDRGIIC